MPAKWKPANGKTWRMRLEEAHPSHGKVVAVPARMRGRVGGAGTMVIPRPLDIDALVRRVRKGRVLTLGELRARLAARAGAGAACPLTTGIFLRFVAEAAEEDRRAGSKRVAPYWRVVRDDGSMNDKFPGGGAAQARRLRAEGLAFAKGPRRRRVLLLGRG